MTVGLYRAFRNSVFANKKPTIDAYKTLEINLLKKASQISQLQKLIQPFMIIYKLVNR